MMMRWLDALKMNQRVQRTTPDTLESLNYSQSIGGAINSPTWGQGDTSEDVSALYQNTRIDNRYWYDPL